MLIGALNFYQIQGVFLCCNYYTATFIVCQVIFQNICVVKQIQQYYMMIERIFRWICEIAMALP